MEIVGRFVSFRYFLLGRIATALSMQMMMVIIGWQMYGITHSAYDLGLVGLAQFVPALVLCFAAGHVADRYNRRCVLMACLVIQAGIAGLLTAGTMNGWLGRDVILFMSFLALCARSSNRRSRRCFLR